MPELPQIRNFNLKVIFMVHFVFISLSTMGSWSSSSYLFYNFILILLLIWSIYHDQSHEPIQLAIVVNGCSIILDILLLVMGFPSSNFAREKFSAAMAILHLIVRPFSTGLLIKNLEERSGSTVKDQDEETNHENGTPPENDSIMPGITESFTYEPTSNETVTTTELASLQLPSCLEEGVPSTSSLSHYTSVLTGILAGGNESYEDIDRPNIPQSTSNAGGYDFSSAQQI